MDDFELILYDRINAIRDTINKYGVDNFFISFSGGKDSTILHYLIDMALPDNKIPRVYINTGIEYIYIYRFVEELQKKDNRIEIVRPSLPIKQVLEKYGYPFKSKQHAHNLRIYQNQKKLTTTNLRYLGKEEGKPVMYRCPKQLEYQFTEEFNIKVSEHCCDKLKKQPMLKWQKDNNKTINITGMRREEKGLRNQLTCIVTDKDKKVIKFHPLSVVSEEWEDWFIEKYNIEICKLYGEPFNFKRTGCKGCPFALGLQEELDTLERHLPNERKQCEIIWKPIYEEYRRIKFRLKENCDEIY